MSYFAKVNNGIVEKVIAADQEFIDNYIDNEPGEWIQTSYNTHGGIHYGQDGNPDNGIALRGNYASIGDIYDSINDVFYSQRPKDIYGLDCLSWTIGAPTWLWQPPIPMPNSTPENPIKTGWNEILKQWVEL